MAQTELANKLNIANVHIKRLELGKKLPDILIIEKICKILEISITEFFKGGNLDENEIENNEFLFEAIKFTNKNNDKKYIKIINKFLIIIFLFITTIFVYLNLKMMFY